MKLIVNGKNIETKNGITVLELLKELKIEDKTMAAAINMQVIKKDQWCKRVINHDEKIEFLHFVGGG